MADSNVPITSGAGTNIDTRTNTASEHRQVVVLGEGAALSDLIAPFRPDALLRVATEPSVMLYDTFDAAADTARWTTSGTVPPTQATGTLTVSAGTVASAWSAQTSVAIMPLTINSYVTPNALIATEAGLKTGSYRFVGLGVLAGSPTAAAPFVNAVGFEWDPTTGVLSGVVWSNSVRTQSISLSAVQPSDAANHRYLMYYKSSKVYFEIDGLAVGSIAYPAPQVSNLPMVIANINGLSTVSPAAVFTATFLGVADSAGHGQYLADATYPWRRAAVGKSGGLSVKGTSPTGQTLAVTAATPVTGAGLDVTEAGNVTFVIKNTVAATAFTGVPVIVFEQSDDNVQWGPLPVTSVGGVVASSPVIATGAANVEQSFDAAMEGVNWIRVRVTTAQATNGMTVVTVLGGMPFSPMVAVNGTVTTAQAALTKGAQGTTGVSVQELHDAGRNQTNYFMAAPIATTTAEVMQSMTGYKAGAAVGATATPAVVTTGKTYRITKVIITFIAATALGSALVRLRANLTGVGVVGSPLVMNWQVGQQIVFAAGYAATYTFDYPEGLEFAAGTGIAVGVIGEGVDGVTGTAAGKVLVSIEGYEY